MRHLDQLVLALHHLPPADRDREEVKTLKRSWAKEQGSSRVPSNIQILKTYHGMVERGEIDADRQIEQLLRKRSIRSKSGIVAVQVLTKPFYCPGKCIFCPTDATMPKSYINTQPGAMRALLNQFDPYKQVYNRLLSLKLTGHAIDKIEMIVLGGTWDVYPRNYKTQFVKGLYDACNSFDQFLEQIQIDYDNPKAARYTATDGIDIDYPDQIDESLRRNETAAARIIGLTIETRPEYVTDRNCRYRRSLGVTRIEMGIQTLHNPVHEANVRGHDNEAIRQAMHRLRQRGFKISNHYMPGLYQSTPEMDRETFQIAFSTPWIKSDELKFYPTAVIPNTGLYDLYKSGEYTPIQPDDLQQIIRTFKTEIVPPYARIKRLARDFDTNEVVAGANTPNLRQLVMNELIQEFREDTDGRQQQYARLESQTSQGKTSSLRQVDHIDALLDLLTEPMSDLTQDYFSLTDESRDIDPTIETYTLGGKFDTATVRNFVCLCTRCREVRHRQQRQTQPFVVVRRYRSSVGEEMFVSMEDRLGYLYGFTRLLLPDQGQTLDEPGLGSETAMIRELHVYGTLASFDDAPPISGDSQQEVQHQGIGSQLMHLAEQIIIRRDYRRLSVISGVGVKTYYEQVLGYEREGTYMVKTLSD